LPTVCVLGLRGGGKSYLVKNYFLDSQPRHLVIDPLDEYEGYFRYVPHIKLMENYDSLNEEIKLAHKRLIFPNVLTLEDQKKGKVKPKRLKMVVYEEADLYVPAQRLLNSSIRKMYTQCRHMQVDLIAVSRRPTDLNTYIMDTADYLIVFKIAGANALKSLRNMNSACVDAIMTLNYDKYEFLLFNRDRTYKKYTLNSLPEGHLPLER